MDKDTFLDLEELIGENKKKETVRIALFKEILHKIHSHIREKNRNRIKCMHYTVPMFIPGKPMFDHAVLLNYLMHHLTENGFLVRLVNQRTLYLSWDETDLNLEKFRQKKAELSHEVDEMYLESNGGGGNYEHQRVTFQTMQDRQAKQRQIREEREQRLSYQKARFQDEDGNFHQFMKKY